MTYTYYHISKKSDYAIRALFELASKSDNAPVNVRRLAEAQDIPIRFLEIILNELKQGGFLVSVRGKAGGYQLAKPADEITLAQIIMFFDKSHDVGNGQQEGAHPGESITGGIMHKVNSYIDDVCNDMTLQRMVDEERKKYAYDYVI